MRDSGHRNALLSNVQLLLCMAYLKKYAIGGGGKKVSYKISKSENSNVIDTDGCNIIVLGLWKMDKNQQYFLFW